MTNVPKSPHGEKKKKKLNNKFRNWKTFKRAVIVKCGKVIKTDDSGGFGKIKMLYSRKERFTSILNLRYLN